MKATITEWIQDGHGSAEAKERDVEVTFDNDRTGWVDISDTDGLSLFSVPLPDLLAFVAEELWK